MFKPQPTNPNSALFIGQNINLVNLRWLRKQLACLLHQRLRYLAVQVSIASRFIVERIENAVLPLVMMQAIPVHSLGLTLSHLRTLFEKRLDILLFPRLRLQRYVKRKLRHLSILQPIRRSGKGLRYTVHWKTSSK